MTSAVLFLLYKNNFLGSEYLNNLSVIVNGIGNNERFFKKLFTEIGEEIAVDIKKDTISFKNVSEKNNSKLYKGLAKAIINEFEKKLVLRAVNKNCECFDKSDKLEIWKLSMKHLLDDEFLNNNNYLYRLEIIKNKLAECFGTTDTIYLDGFVNFRLTDYTNDLEEVVDESVGEYMLELEYKEFINMLKFFLSLQLPKYGKVDIICGDEIRIIADENDVTEECICDFQKDAGHDDGNRDDFVLNSLISIAPKRINVFVNNNHMSKELRQTLEQVFENKIVFHSR